MALSKSERDSVEAVLKLFEQLSPEGQEQLVEEMQFRWLRREIGKAEKSIERGELIRRRRGFPAAAGKKFAIQKEREQVKRLVFTPNSLQDFQEIHDYIAKDNADRASDFIDRLQERCNELVGFPGIGQKRDEIRVGCRSVTEGEYVIFYRVLNKKAVVIMRIIHAKRNLGKIVFFN